MLDVINVLSELERIGITFDWAGDDEVVTHCPFHDDSSPSCFINVKKRAFKCQTAGCNSSGDFLTFLAGKLKTTRALVWAEMSSRYTVTKDRVVEMAVVEMWHQNIWKAAPLHKELEMRGITDDLIRKYRIGENDGRITIPIMNEQGAVVNVRRYLPGAPGRDKFKNLRGRGQIRLFPVEQLKYDSLLITGGELKAIAAAAQLNPHGIGAITTVAGEGNWDLAFNSYLRGKNVYVCMDVDSAGESAADLLCMQVYRACDRVSKLRLPLDVDRFPKGDISDFVYHGGNLYDLIESAVEWEPPRKATLSENEPVDADLARAVHADTVGSRIRVTAVITALDTTPYLIPKTVAYECDKAQPECAKCELFDVADSEITLHPESPALLDMVAAPRSKQRDAIMRGLGVPPACSVVQFTPVAYYDIEEARVSPRLEIADRTAERVMLPALCIGHSLELNEGYSMVGRMHPHPATQQSTLLISEYEATTDALSNYTCENLEQLVAFRPSEWTLDALTEKLNTIYHDLETNVTRIIKRRLLHLIIDMTYHSPLLINFDDRLQKGWVETLIVGDSAQGKSETATRLMQHYCLGEMVECKNASVAGLLGGLQQLGSRWFVTWGVIPTHDKRLVILEELKGASVDVISKLTNMRSSGIAELPKIEKRRAHARTRLIALSNPRSDREVATYSHGIDVVKELIGGLEDIRRFDAVLIVARSEVDIEEMNKAFSEREIVEHVYTSDICKELILWSWTRNENQVHFLPETSRLILQEATKLCNDYDDSIPIVDRGSMRLKLARLSAALACRTFSANEAQDTAIVRPCHVEFVVQTLRKIYDAPHFGYRDYTENRRIVDALDSPEDIKKRLKGLPFPLEFIRHMLAANSVDPHDVADWSGWERLEAQALMSFLVRKRAIRRAGRLYYKTPAFIKLLKSLVDDPDVNDRPEFIKEEF